MKNTRLKSQLVEENISKASRDMSVLKEEVEELCWQLHKAQEWEVNSEQRIQDLKEEHEVEVFWFSGAIGDDFTESLEITWAE